MIWYDHLRFVLRFQDVFNNYSDEIIFTSLLDPYLERRTVSVETSISTTICRYLYSCLQQTEYALDLIAQAGSDFLQPSFWWKDLESVAKNAFLEILKTYLPHISWQTAPDVYKTDDLQATATDGKNVIKIKLDLQNKNAKLLEKGKEQPIHLVVRKASRGTFKDEMPLIRIGIPNQRILDFASSVFHGKLEELSLNLALELIRRGSASDLSKLHALPRDKRFMTLASKAVKTFISSYEEISRRRRSS